MLSRPAPGGSPASPRQTVSAPLRQQCPLQASHRHQRKREKSCAMRESANNASQSCRCQKTPPRKIAQTPYLSAMLSTPLATSLAHSVRLLAPINVGVDTLSVALRLRLPPIYRYRNSNRCGPNGPRRVVAPLWSFSCRCRDACAALRIGLFRFEV